MGINSNPIFYLSIAVYITVVSAGQLKIFTLDKSWICNIKKTCVDCLRLSHCSWCSSANTCFSENLPYFKNYCQEDRIRHVNYGNYTDREYDASDEGDDTRNTSNLVVSLEENAICACDPDHLADEKNCQHPDVISGECSGRGTCICGRCFCNTNPDPENPSKKIMGEYCQYDNFSCNDTSICNEGPYNIYELQTNEENLKHAEKTGTR